jgi:cyclic pyranopterin phosphate synthase
VRLFCAYGVTHVRLTGGEPLMRQDIADVVGGIALIPEIECRSITTNGYNLADLLPFLKENNISKINVSLDTLKRDRFTTLTGIDGLSRVTEAIFAAKSIGLKQVKLNVVLIRGFNDDEILDFIEFSNNLGIDVRFIEYFPTRLRIEAHAQHFVPSADVLRIIEERYGILEPLGSDSGAGPAQYFRRKGHSERVGLISSVSDFFCNSCNRLRLTSDGKLYVCLRSDYCVDLKKPLRQGRQDLLKRLIENALMEKKGHNKMSCDRLFEMSRIGG